MKNIFSLISHKERRILGLFCLILGLALVFYLFFTLGIKKSYIRSENHLVSVQRSLQNTELSRSQKTTESQAWEAVQEDMEELRETYFYTNEEWIREVRSDLQHILDEVRIQHSRKNFEYAQFEKEGIQKVIVDFTVTGKYAMLKNFIHSVETFQRFLMIEKIDFLDIDPQGQGIKVRIRLAGYHAIF